MSIWDVFCLFFIFSLLQPIIRQKMLESHRERKIQQIEKQRQSRVIVLVHRQETLGLLGFPLVRYIDIEDAEAVLRAIKLTDPNLPIDLILHTPGGLVIAAEQIAYALCRHPAKVTVFVPHYAMSGGTLIALAANEVVMDETAVLGPVDAQLGQYPAASILQVVEQKPAEAIDDETVILADMSRKAINQVRQTVTELMNDRMEREKVEKLATVLTSGIWTHDYPIRVREAQMIGLPVKTEMPTEVYQLMSLYPQTVQRRPSVGYIPMTYLSLDERKRRPVD